MALAEAVTLVSLAASKKNVGIVINCQDNLNVYGDKDQIVRVLQNLLANAVNFSPEGGVVECFCAQTNEQVKVKICDEGLGVDDQHKVDIFERFKRVEGLQRSEGYGLGLPICKLIVQLHGGTMGVEDNQPRGSVFWFSLPTELMASQT